MIKKVENYIERQFKYLQIEDNPAKKVTFLCNAFGALDFAAEQASNEEFDDYMALWDEWKKKFEKEIWG